MAEKKKKIPYTFKPEDMTLEEWQCALRRQFAETHEFNIRRLDVKGVFGDYLVKNPRTNNEYKIAFRGIDSDWNYCSCQDFKTNQLGTCKHIEAVCLHLEEKYVHRNALKKTYIPSYTSVYLSYRGERTVKIRIGEDFKNDYEALAAEYFTPELELKPQYFVAFEQFLQRARDISPDFRCYEDAFAFILNRRQDEYRQKLLSKHYPNGKLNKDLLHATLYPYQEEGILFAAKAGRTLIADEMGLGKTLQAIGTAELLQKEMRISSVLIICPTSLKYQWEAEIKRFTDNNVKVIEGPAIKRREQYTGSEFYKIVSYNSAANDISQLVQFGFDMVILDEAQRIKNWKTQIAQAVKKLMPDYTVVLTGTPLENKLEELYSIVQYIDPYRLGPYYKFLNQYQITTDNGQVIGYKDLHAVSNKLDGLLIRRRKRDVQIQLPGRMDKILYVPLTTEQADIHEEHKQTVARLVLKWRHNRFLSENDRKRLLLSLTQMRMVSDSTYIQDQKTRFDTKIGELMNILHEVFENGDEKVVIFSQWERMTRLVAYELEKEGVGYEYLHGSIPSKDRKRLIENFNRPECRVFLSTDAGSTGLNLQAASLIINLDIPWNPAVLEQRIARIHRMGQKNAISVINFVSRGSIEEQMLDKLTFKSNLFEGVLDNGQDSIFINESKFSELMNTVEDITKTIEPSTSIDQEELESNAQATPERATEPSTSPTVEEEEEETSVDESLVEPSAELEKETSTPPVDKPAPEQLVQTGLQFISGLAQALSTPESTQQLVASLVEEDKETGKTCLKIPVESRESVEKLFGLFGKLFAGGK